MLTAERHYGQARLGDEPQWLSFYIEAELAADLGRNTHLTTALDQLPTAWVRTRAALLVDLAFAHAGAGDRDAATTHARTARQLAGQIHSDRHLRRLAALVLPTGGRAAT